MNLLSLQQKEIIRKEILFKFYFVLLTVFSFWAAVFLILIYSINLYLKIQIPALEGRIAIEKSSEKAAAYGVVEQEITELNAGLFAIDRIRSKDFQETGKILRKVSSVVSEGISFTNLSYQGDVLTISGHADTRDRALVLKSALETDSLCARLQSPVPVKELDVSFTFVCSLTDVEKNQQVSPAEEDEGNDL